MAQGQTSETRGLLILLAANDMATSELLVNSLKVGRPVMLLDARLPVDKFIGIFDAYRPQSVAYPFARDDIRQSLLNASYGRTTSESTWEGDGYGEYKIHPDLALLLSTSGTTGSPKFVRLSNKNLDSNASQIAESIGLMSTDVGITSLPLHYSFGFSILNSHMAAKSPVVVTDLSILEPQFWELCASNKVSVMAGVPSTCELILRLRLHERFPDSLRLLIQAGGRLRNEAQLELCDIMNSRDGDFLPMYGQTEASPRMACMPAGQLREKIGSVGRALNGGQFEVAVLPGESRIGEVTYNGPNVMLGYAESWEDLSLGDEQHQALYTGDIGYLDEDGFLFLTGRTKRIAKINGIRVSLDEVERIADQWGSNMAISRRPDSISIFFELQETQLPGTRQIAGELGIPARNLSIYAIDKLPMLTSGKRNYKDLEEADEP